MFLKHYENRLLLAQKHYSAKDIMAEVAFVCGYEGFEETGSGSSIRVDGLSLQFENENIVIVDHIQLELASRMLAAYMHNTQRMQYTVSNSRSAFVVV
jgi:hypothetical protein